MAVWSYEITIDGFALPNILNGIEVIKGATNPLDQAAPSVATLSLQGLPVINGATQSPDWYIGKTLEIGIRKVGEAQSHRLFYGQVTMQSTSPIDALAAVVVTELSAQSFMSRLSQITLDTDTMPAATEYERIYSMLERQEAQTWADLPSTMTWADIPTLYLSDITWAQWLFPESDYVSRLVVPNWNPGDPDPSIQLEAYTGGPVKMLDYVIELAMGVGAFVYEQDQLIAPQIWYLSRADFDSAPPATINLAGAATSYGLTDDNGIFDIYTEARVSNSTLSASDANFDAMRTYGVRLLELDSPAALEADLQTIATTKVSALSRPVPDLTRVSVDYNQLAAASRQWDVGTIRTLSGIPATFGGTQQYQIRGITFRGTKDRLDAEWVLLSRRTLFPGPMWRNIGPVTTWNDLTTTWQDWIS